MRLSRCWPRPIARERRMRVAHGPYRLILDDVRRFMICAAANTRAIGLTIDPAVAELMLVCLALLFGTAAVHKLRDLRLFDEIFAAYGVLPLIPRWRLARLLPVVEMAVAAGALLAATRRLAVVVAALLLLTYAAAIALNLYRGKRDLACGCGGADERRTIAPWMVGRNLLLAAVFPLSLLPWSSRPFEVTDAVTIGFGALTCGV